MEILNIVHRELECQDGLGIISLLNNSFHCDNCLRLSWIGYCRRGIKRNALNRGVSIHVKCNRYSPMDTFQQCPGVMSLEEVNYIEVSISGRISKDEVRRRWPNKVYAQWVNGAPLAVHGSSYHTVLYMVNDDDVIYRYISIIYGCKAICESCNMKQTVELEVIQKFSTGKNMDESNRFQGMENIYPSQYEKIEFDDMLKLIKCLYFVKEAGYMRLFDDDDSIIFVLEISEDMQAVRYTMLVPRNGRLDSFIM